MRHLLFGLAAILTGNISLGSTYIACDVEAIVFRESQINSAGTLTLNLRINRVQNDDDAHQGCELDQEISIQVPNEGDNCKVSDGDTIVLRYTYYSGMGENGIVEEENWTIQSISVAD